MTGVAALSERLLIISCLQGGGGHRLGRILSCFDKVHWYAHQDNGLDPWSFASTDVIKETRYSKYHYDRILPDGNRLPLIGSRIEKYWDSEAWLDNWRRLVSGMQLPTGYLSYVIHDSPAYIRRHFPHSIIVNVLCDATTAATRHLQTSAKYRIDYKLRDQTPSYQSKWVNHRNRLLAIKPQANEMDLWLFVNNGSAENYLDEMIEINKAAIDLKIKESHHADITISWQSFLPENYVSLFGVLDPRYVKLMQDTP